MTESPSPLTMLLSRHTKRREFIALIGGGGRMAARGAVATSEPLRSGEPLLSSTTPALIMPRGVRP